MADSRNLPKIPHFNITSRMMPQLFISNISTSRKLYHINTINTVRLGVIKHMCELIYIYTCPNMQCIKYPRVPPIASRNTPI